MRRWILLYCCILFVGTTSAQSPSQVQGPASNRMPVRETPVPTFADVKRIVQTHCISCHRPGEAAPFSLLTYEDLAKRASFIKQIIESNFMPPWKADAHYRDFGNNRSLSAAEKSVLVHWIDAGAPKSKIAADNAPIPTNQTSYGRPPDLTLKLDSAYQVDGDNQEKFVEFRVAYTLKEDQNIEAVEFYSNNKKIIHHINYGFYSDVDSNKIVYYTGWIPGASYESYPPGFGWKLPHKGTVVFTVHYSPIGADEKSMVGVHLFFTHNPIKRQIIINPR